MFRPSWIFYGLMLCCPLTPIYSQQVIIKKTELKEGRVILHYELQDDNPDRHYTLRLYSSQDNYVQPLQKVSGDIGINIPVGGNKQVVWDALEELDSGSTGRIALELKGQVYIPFINPAGFEGYSTFKRGKPYDITWTGGRGDNVLNFDLYKGEEKIHTIPNVANAGNLTLVIPTNVKPGKKYVFRISDANNPDEVVYTIQFDIKRKIPLGVKLGLGLVAGGAIGYLISSGATTSEPKIGEPPLPTR